MLRGRVAPVVDCRRRSRLSPGDAPALPGRDVVQTRLPRRGSWVRSLSSPTAWSRWPPAPWCWPPQWCPGACPGPTAGCGSCPCGARASGAFGRLVVLSGPATWLGAVDLFCALTAKTAMGVPAVRVGARGPDSSSPSKTELQPVQVKRLAAVILTGLVASHVTGIFAAGPHSYTRCIGWPIWQLIGSDPHPWLAGPATGASGPGSSPRRHYGGTGRPLEAATLVGHRPRNAVRCCWAGDSRSRTQHWRGSRVLDAGGRCAVVPGAADGPRMVSSGRRRRHATAAGTVEP